MPLDTPMIPIQALVRFEPVNTFTHGLYSFKWKRPDPLGFISFGLVLGEIWVYDMIIDPSVWVARYAPVVTTWTDLYTPAATVWTDR